MGNQYPYCFPLTTDTWVNGSSHQFVWNFNFPFYVSSNTLNLNMYYIKNYQYTPIKTWANLATSDGALPVTVDDTWFPSVTYNNNKTWHLYLYYLPTGMNASAELQNTNSLYPRPYNFSVIQLPSPQPPGSNTTNPNDTNPTNSNTPSSYSSDQHSGLPGWGIALIVIAAVAVIAALGISAWAFFVYLPRKRQQKRHMPGDIKMRGGGGPGGSYPTTPNEKETAESIYSDSPIVVAAAGLRSSVSVGGATTAPSSISHRPDSPSYPSIHHLTSLHSNDTMTMAESLRQMIHRPDWTTTDEDMDEEKRRRLGEELLQRQLAEDGATTMVKQTQPSKLKSMTSQIPKARTAIVVAESSDSLSHSSSTTSLSMNPSSR
ncbi:unnamed protein product [Absidia cylindrospora]